MAHRGGGGGGRGGGGRGGGRGGHHHHQQHQQQEASDGFLEHAVRASLVDYVDKRLFILLRDGRQFLGYMRTFDQYNNVVLEDAVERRMCVVDEKTHCCDVKMGLFIFRGENVALMGEVDYRKDRDNTAINWVTEAELNAMLLKQRNEAKAKKEKLKAAGKLKNGQTPGLPEQDTDFDLS